MTNNSKLVRIEGIVEEALPGLIFRVKVNVGGSDEREVLGHPAGKMKLYRIRIIPGDKVLLEMPDPNDRRGRIVRRL